MKKQLGTLAVLAAILGSGLGNNMPQSTGKFMGSKIRYKKRLKHTIPDKVVKAKRREANKSRKINQKKARHNKFTK